MLEIIRKGRDNTKSLKSGVTDGAFYKWKGKVEGCDLLYVHCKLGSRRESEWLFTIHSLPGARAGEQQEVHFHAIIINQGKSLPRDVMGAKSVKGVQKGIIQINGRESLRRLLNNESVSNL